MSLFWWSPTSWGCVVSTRPVKNAPPTSHASLSTEDRASFNVDHLTYLPLHHVPSTSFSSSSGVPKTGRMHQIRVHLQWLGRLWPCTCMHVWNYSLCNARLYLDQGLMDSQGERACIWESISPSSIVAFVTLSLSE